MKGRVFMTLADAEFGVSYKVDSLDVKDAELENFLFTLGCYSGEEVVVVSKISGSYVISVRDGRYNVDKNLAKSILVSKI